MRWAKGTSTRGVGGTPRQTNGSLPGRTRGVIIELAGREGIGSERRPVSEGELRTADEVLIASAGGGCSPTPASATRFTGGGTCRSTIRFAACFFRFARAAM